MNFKEEIENAIEQLKPFGMDRRKIENELGYSEFSIDQLLSRGGNGKLLSSLRLLLTNKILLKSMQEGTPATDNPIPPVNSKEKIKAVKGKGQSIKDVIERLDRIEVNLIETRHGVELNQALAKANLFQNAKLESVLTKKSHQSILEGLNKVTAKIFDEMHELTNQTNEVHS